MTSLPSERGGTEGWGRGWGRGRGREGEEEGRREGGSHVVNTCSLRGDWSTANLFTYRLTTQEPLFLPLPSHPPFIPSYLTFPSLPSDSGRLPSSSRTFLPFFFSASLANPNSSLPHFSPVPRLLPPRATLSCHSRPPPCLFFFFLPFFFSPPLTNI